MEQTDRQICAYMQMRLGSERVKQKMLREIGGIPLAQIAIRQLEAFGDYGINPVLGIPEADAPLRKMAMESRVGLVILRSKRSAFGETVQDINHQLPAMLVQFDWMIHMTGCRPFIRRETIRRLCELAKTTVFPVMTVFEHRGIVWDEYGKQVIGQPGETINTKRNPVFLTPGHTAEIYAPEDSVNPEVPFLRYSLDMLPEEMIDIDTEHDIDFANTYAKGVESWEWSLKNSDSPSASYLKAYHPD